MTSSLSGLAASGDWFIGRTGYTGEDGLEIMLPAEQSADFWQVLLGAGCKPCGLGARDTLRLEAGMNLYGSDMDESISPLAANMAWTIAWEPAERDFIGRQALEAQAAGDQPKLVGLVLEERAVLRGHQKVIVDGVGEGEITSGTPPRLWVTPSHWPCPCDRPTQRQGRDSRQTAGRTRGQAQLRA